MQVQDVHLAVHETIEDDPQDRHRKKRPRHVNQQAAVGKVRCIGNLPWRLLQVVRWSLLSLLMTHVGRGGERNTSTSGP